MVIAYTLLNHRIYGVTLGVIDLFEETATAGIQETEEEN